MNNVPSRAKAARKAKPTDIQSHWAKLIENLELSSQDFYQRLERALTARKVPDLKISRVTWPEGGILSPRREYLRLSRERLMFDVCGAQFGSGFFVSTWCGVKPLRMGWLTIELIVLAIFGLINWCAKYYIYGLHGMYLRLTLGFSNDAAALTLLILVVLAVLSTIVYFGQDLDAALMHMPVVGYFYERNFRHITFYRIDLICMYQAAVQSAVTEVIDEVAKAQGIPSFSEFDRRPIFRDLLQPKGSHGQ